MANVIETILKVRNSESYIKYQEYHMNNILGITKVWRNELTHSNFIAWLLDDDSSLLGNHEPLYKFVLMLLYVAGNQVNEKARVDKQVLIKFIGSDFIENKNATVTREKDNIDILLEIKTKEKILPIIIENKVNSKENGKNKDQTQVYFDRCEKQYKDKKIYFDPIYVFLKPKYNETKPKCEQYLIVSYQELVDYVIEPVMKECKSEESKRNIRIYLQCLSFQKDNEKGDKIMAMSSEEKEILLTFLRENKDIFEKAIELLDDLDSKQKKQVINAFTNAEDTTKYSFDGNHKLGKGRLVLEVVKYYCQEHPNCTLEDLKKAFPNKLAKNKTKGVLDLEKNIGSKDKGANGEPKRYYVDDPITLSTGENILVSSQWEISHMKNFIDHCKNQLGYDIQEEEK